MFSCRFIYLPTLLKNRDPHYFCLIMKHYVLHKVPPKFYGLQFLQVHFEVNSSNFKNYQPVYQ